MPGPATHFHVLDRTINQLPPGLSGIADLLRDNPYAYLGALGPALMDFISSDPPPASGAPANYSLVWRRLLSVIAGDPGLIKTMAKIQALIDGIQALADARDCHGLEDFRDSGRLDDVSTLSDQFTALLGTVDDIAGQIYDMISGDLKPKFCSLDPSAPTPPPTEWPARDFFSWKKTGRFVQNLIAKGNSTGDSRLLAYAYGYLVAYATSVTGSPFINAVVGGPMRTQWWRQRFIKNYVDAWVYGFYGAGATMQGKTGDEPNPPYDQWPSLCSANLHKKIELPGTMNPEDFLNSLNSPFPQVVPGDFADHWFEAVQDTFGSSVPPEIVPGGLNSAYLMTWLVLWFQTSGVPFGCVLQPPAGPPSDCTGDKPETDPFNFGPGGSPPGPPIPSPDVEDNTATQVCAVLLIILGGALFAFGGGLAGIGALAGGIALLDCNNAVTIDWAGWDCKIFWFREYMFNGLVGLQRMLSLAGFVYPEAKALGSDSNALKLAGIDLPFESAINLVKSPREGRDQPFPSKCWNTSVLKGILTFNQRPTAGNTGFETPRTIAYIAGWQYPSFFVEDPANSLANGDVKTNNGILLKYDPPGSAVPFGNAVENAVDLFNHLATNFPNWNLDADRGLAYYTWQFDGGYDPDNVKIKPE